MKPIQNQEEYEATLKELEQMWNRPELDDKHSKEYKRFIQLITAVEIYEDIHFPMDYDYNENLDED